MWKRKLVFLVVTIVVFTPKQPTYAQDAQSHFVDGNQFLDTHQYSKAIIEYKKAIKLNPYYKEAYLNLGKAYQSKGLFKEAISQYKKAIELDRKYVDAYINLGICYEKQNLLASAKINIEKAIELDMVNAKAHFNLANVLHKQHKIKESIEEYIQTTKFDSTYFQAYIKLGDIYFSDLNDDKKAFFYYNIAKKTSPKNELSYLKLGELYFKKKSFNNAIAQYREAVKLNPRNSTGLIQFGWLYLTIADYKNALSVSQKLVNLLPDNSIAHYTLGLTYEKLGRFEEALNEFETTLSLNPEDEMALFHQERIILELNRANVSSLWRQKSSQKHLLNAENYLKEGLLTLSTYEFKRSISLDPQNPNTRLALAKLYELLGRKQLAIEELKKVVELSPETIEPKDRLERLYFEDETSWVHKEKITKEQIPASEINLIICGYSPNFIHYGVDEAAIRMLLSLLNQFPHITLVDKVFLLDDEKDVIEVGQRLKSELALWIKVNENKEMIEIDAELLDLKTLKKILMARIPVRGKDKLIKALSFAAEKVIKSVPRQGVIMKIVDDDVIINIGEIHGIKPEQILEVWKREGELDPLTQKIRPSKLIGKIKILAVEPNISKARIITPRTSKFIGLNDIVK